MPATKKNRRSRKFFGGLNFFRQSAVGETKKYESKSEQQRKDIDKLKNEIRGLEEKIDNEDKEKKKALETIKENTEKTKKELEQKKANLKKLTSWWGGSFTRRLKSRRK